MNICSKCKTEMFCCKSGKKAIFGASHVYNGDEFQCKICDNKVLVCVDVPHEDKNCRGEDGSYIEVVSLEKAYERNALDIQQSADNNNLSIS